MSMFVNAITSNTFQTIAQNTDTCVKIETSLKAIGRPAFTLIDHHTDKEKRKYSATKEFLYQVLCLGIYIAVIPPIFKNGGFKLAQKIFKKENLPNFKNAKEMISYYHLAHLDLNERFLEKNKKYWKRISDDVIDKTLKTKTGKYKDGVPIKDYLKVWEKDKMTKKGKMFKLAKGSIELSSIIGSVVGLTILAPEISHLILHPIMKFLGMEKHPEKAVSNESQILDKKG